MLIVWHMSECEIYARRSLNKDTNFTLSFAQSCSYPSTTTVDYYLGPYFWMGRACRYLDSLSLLLPFKSDFAIALMVCRGLVDLAHNDQSQ